MIYIYFEFQITHENAAQHENFSNSSLKIFIINLKEKSIFEGAKKFFISWRRYITIAHRA